MDDTLIHAIAHAIAKALAAHGISSTAVEACVRDECAALCRNFGGEKHWLPHTYRPARQQAVLDALAEGATINEAAQRTGVTRATAYRIARRSRRP